MRVPSARCAFVALTIVGLAGCNCGSRCSLPCCSAPNLAFWKNNPFKSSSDTLATAVGTPAKPSVLASRSGMTGPGAGYTAGAAGGPSTSPYVGTTTGAGTLGGYPNTQQPYPSYSSTSSTGYNMTAAGGTPYMAPQAGAYGAGSPGSSVGTSPYAGASPYSSAAATPYGPLTESRNTTGGSGYATAGTASPYANSLPASPTGTAAGRYASRFDRFRSGPGRYSGGYDRSGSGVDRYAAGAASSTAPLSRPGGPANSYIPSTAGSPYGGTAASSPYASGSPYAGSSPYAATPSSTGPAAGIEPATNPLDRYPVAGEGGGSTAGGGYSLSSAASSADPASGYRPAASSYTPGATDYTPGQNGYAPPGVSPYRSPASPYRTPAGPYTLPASNPDDPPPYRPGSTSDYAPTTPSGTIPASNSSAYPGGARSIGTGVRPADYAQPVGVLR